MTIPMPTPAPIEITTKVETPPASPRHFSPTAAMLTSLSTSTGTLKRLSSVASESNSPVALTCHASEVTRRVSGSTTPGVETPIASRSPWRPASSRSIWRTALVICSSTARGPPREVSSSSSRSAPP